MIAVATDHPLADWTVDHVHPRGTKNDNSVSPEFNRRLFSLYSHPIRVLDLGCAGGGFVRSIIDCLGFGVGIEGSDYSLRTGRAEWATIPANLFTADITEPFQVCYDRAPQLFDVITAWEVLEHVPDAKLEGVFANVTRHLAPRRSIFVASVATAPDFFDGVEYHATVQPINWWLDRLMAGGFCLRSDLMDYFDGSWVRGPNTGDVSSACLVLDRPPDRR